jgi:hypothetical protein
MIRRGVLGPNLRSTRAGDLNLVAPIPQVFGQYAHTKSDSRRERDWTFRGSAHRSAWPRKSTTKTGQDQGVAGSRTCPYEFQAGRSPICEPESNLRFDPPALKPALTDVGLTR